MIPILRQTNPLLTASSSLLKIHLNMSTYILVFLVVPFSLTFQSIIYMCSSSLHFTLHATQISFSLAYYTNYSWQRVETTKLLITQLSRTSSHSSLFGPDIFLNTLFLNTLSLYSSCNIRNEISHPCRTTEKSIWSCIL
jgi:hypothetical protein